jgi:hypothetical protein
MKKLIVLMSLIVITSCNKEDIQPDPEPVVNCECDRVVDVSSFNLPDGTTFGNYVTVNDCTNFQQNHSFTGTSNQPSIGDCK